MDTRRAPSPGFNKRLRDADAEYARRLADREARKAEVALAAGWHPEQGTKAATKSYKRRQAIKRNHRQQRGNAHQD